MPKQEVSLTHLRSYLPEGSFEAVNQYLVQYRVHLTVTRQRQSVLGDYRHAHDGKAHRISVNGNLNKYSFLITLLHELAHLFTYERYGHRVPAHGKQWKEAYGGILSGFMGKGIFTSDIEAALLQSIKNPAASSCGDHKLLRVLREHDPKKDNHVLVEQVKEGASFRIKGNRIFIRGEKIRTRYKCIEPATKKWYLFSGMYEVELVGLP